MKIIVKTKALFSTFLVVGILMFSTQMSAQGPISPEASSFEPVDATDMVNLSTGSLTYVLPLLNVPSPEGGYPIALSYHAGIAMDQEASWVGLGWNINPGAINRSVNGYPDDWKDAQFKEYFYDSGDQSTYITASLGYSSFSSGVSVGLSLSYSDDRGFGGSVSLGYGADGIGKMGISAGTNGISASSSFSAGPLGGSISTNGIGLSAGSGPLKVNLDLNSDWSSDVSAEASYGTGAKGKRTSVGISISSHGVSITSSIKGYGTGAKFTFENSVSQSDYNIDKSGWFIPLYIPTGEGMITASFGYQKIEYYLDKLESTGVNGPLYFKDAKPLTGRWLCTYYDGLTPIVYECDPEDVNSNATDTIGYVNDVDSFGDIYEVDFGYSSQSLDLDTHNAVFPNYDNYRVTAQGLSGTMRPSIYKNGALLGLRKDIEEDNNDYEITYNIQDNSNTSFNITPEFHFESEYSSSLLIEPAIFNSSVNASSIFDYLDNVSQTEVARKRGGRYVEAFTNEELSNPSTFNTGLLKANANINYGDTTLYEPDGIGAFKVTTADGKTYHYALPVYNHEIVSRQFGFIPERPGEDLAFFEKRQLKKYATHWLLTAITGPDFIDLNANNLADDGDYGYWVSMDYGKWSDGYIWKTPHGEDYNIDPEDENTKSYTWGRKEIYYLDQIKTRTHTALFIKEHRNDARGQALVYKHRLNKNNSRNLSFNAQSLLRLKEIILVKNEDLANLSKSNLSNINSFPSANYTNTVDFYDPKYQGGGLKTINYSLQDNVLDSKDFTNLNILYDVAIKTIDFDGYSYDLAAGAPNTFGGVSGRLTLEHVAFKGKGGVQVQPSYDFEYIPGTHNINHMDEWGYNKLYPSSNSLNEIKLPTGGKIKIEYESNTFTSAIDHDLEFPTTIPDGQNRITVTHTEPFSIFGIGSNSQLPYRYLDLVSCTEYYPNGDPIPNNGRLYDYKSYNGIATVISVSNAGKTLTLELDSSPTIHQNIFTDQRTCFELDSDLNISMLDVPTETFNTSIRVKSITTTDDINEYKTEYNYNIPGTNTTSGIVSYIPFVNQVTDEVPYGMELPPPVPMYEYVKMITYGNDNTSLGHVQYQFNVMPKKSWTLDFNLFPETLDVTRSTVNGTNSPNGIAASISDIHIRDNLASLGRLISQSSYNNKGQLLSKTINNYKRPESITQGIAQESFQTYKHIDYETNGAGYDADKWLITNSTKTIYPSVLESTTTIQGGYTSTTYFDKYDTVSGQLLETITESSDGTTFKTEIVPAYIKYPEMGSKADNVFNKNMLTQETMTKSYIDDSGNWIETGVGINTWSPYQYNYNANGGSYSEDVWRKHKTYVWDGQLDENGLYDNFSGDSDGFNWSIYATSQNPNWKLVSEITQYDNYSLPIEVRDINGNYASTKTGDNATKTIAVGNAALNEMFYCGAEYLSGSNFDDNISSVGRTSVKSHTGKYSIEISSQQGFFTSVPSGHKAGRYKISVWASKENYTRARVYDGVSLRSFNGERVTAGDWVLLNHYIDWDTSAKSVYVTSSSGSIFYDDFRIHPIESSVITYVYNEWEELEAVLGNNNLATLYEYDDIGRLVRVFDEVVDNSAVVGGFKKSVEHDYQYSRSIDNPIDPIHATVTYGSSSPNHQEFIATVTGGSGDYTYRWYKGIGSSSSNFESTWSSSAPTFIWNNISGCDIH